MYQEKHKVDNEIVETLLSNCSSNPSKENTLTLFSSKLHTPIVLNSSNYHYVALHEIEIGLYSENIKIPNQNPGIIYFRKGH